MLPTTSFVSRKGGESDRVQLCGVAIPAKAAMRLSRTFIPTIPMILAYESTTPSNVENHFGLEHFSFFLFSFFFHHYKQLILLAMTDLLFKGNSTAQ